MVDGVSATESCDVDETSRRRRIAWLYEVSRRALRLARRYLRDGESGRQRASVCTTVVSEYRREIHALRLQPTALHPGLAPATATPHQAPPNQATG